jgi:transcriptional regulator
MYTPADFEVTDRRWILDLIERYPFATLIAGDGESLSISHIPIVAREDRGGLRLYGHVAAANPHAQSIRARAPATIVFRGPHAYVSASWYEKPYATVPTWNYIAIQVCGRLQPYDEWSAVTMLSENLEGRGSGAWEPQRLDAGVRERSLRAIVAFELIAEQIYAKAKLSQNRSEADRKRVFERLCASDDQTERECAEAMNSLGLE